MFIKVGILFYNNKNWQKFKIFSNFPYAFLTSNSSHKTHFISLVKQKNYKNACSAVPLGLLYVVLLNSKSSHFDAFIDSPVTIKIRNIIGANKKISQQRNIKSKMCWRFLPDTCKKHTTLSLMVLIIEEGLVWGSPCRQ